MHKHTQASNTQNILPHNKPKQPAQHCSQIQKTQHSYSNDYPCPLNPPPYLPRPLQPFPEPGLHHTARREALTPRFERSFERSAHRTERIERFFVR
eukprot:586846-Amorphochlora_amoeboformis.AAC.3